MSIVERQPIEDVIRYTIAEFVEIRRDILRYARFLPIGPERNQRRQMAVSLGALFKDDALLAAHTKRYP